MTTFDSSRVQLLHFSHLRNFGMIMQQDCVMSDSLVRERGCLEVEVGDTSIKQRRRDLRVPVGPGGPPADYVPFYFAPRSPMLYRISKGGVATYVDGQDPLVYCVTTVGRVVESGHGFAFSDGNCASALTKYACNVAELESHVDWPLMKERYWTDTAEDPDRVRRRQAEFLVHRELPLGDVLRFVVRTDEAKATLRAKLGDALVDRRIVVERDWYY